MKRIFSAVLASAFLTAIAVPVTHADSIGGVENARAKERSGRYLTSDDAEQLRRYGGNDDGYGWSHEDRRYGYGNARAYSDYDVYAEPRRRTYRRYYD